MPGRSQVVGLLWRWHRRIGLLVGVFVLVLSATGIALNHSSGLALDQRFIRWPWLLRVYGDNSSNLPAFKVGEHWLYRSAAGHLYYDTREVAACRGELVGGLLAGDLIYAGCGEELLLLSTGGELVESLGAAMGLPTPVSGIGLVEEQLVLQSGDAWWQADLDAMDFSSPAATGSLIMQLAPGRLPAELRVALPGQSDWLSWERLLLDLHSGRLFGRAGVLVTDAAAVLLLLLALSGVSTWWLHRRRHLRRR